MTCACPKTSNDTGQQRDSVGLILFGSCADFLKKKSFVAPNENEVEQFLTALLSDLAWKILSDFRDREVPDIGRSLLMHFQWRTRMQQLDVQLRVVSRIQGCCHERLYSIPELHWGSKLLQHISFFPSFYHVHSALHPLNTSNVTLQNWVTLLWRRA